MRLGCLTNMSLPTIQQVVDCFHLPCRFGLIDIYLISQCRFFIEQHSGPDVLVWIFKKLVVIVNMTDCSLGMPIRKGDLAS